MTYVIGSDVFVENRRGCSEDDFNRLLKGIEKVQACKGATSPQAVKNELSGMVGGEDRLKTWIDDHSDFFDKSDDGLAAALRDVGMALAAVDFPPHALRWFLTSTDVYVLAQANSELGGIVVTCPDPDVEVWTLTLPRACRELGVPCVPVSEMLAAEGVLEPGAQYF